MTKTSYALFSDKITSINTIEVEVVNNKPNPPVLDTHMVPVYYDEENETWNKADETNQSLEYKWYDYDNKMWANSITYDHTKVYNEEKTSDGKTFNGSQYVNTGNENYDFGSSITAIARFKTSEGTASEFLIGNAHSAGFYLSVYGNVVRFYIYGNTSNTYKGVLSTTTIEKNTWYTAAATYDGNYLKLYINGNLETTLELEDTIKVSPQPIFIGANPNNNNAHTEYFTGTISDSIVINDCLTEEEIAMYYSEDINYQPNNNLVFHEKYNNTFSYINGAAYQNDGMSFDGIDDYIDAGYENYDFGNNITLIARFKLYTFTSSDIILGNPNTAGTFIQVDVNKKLRFAIFGEGQEDYYRLVSNETLKENTWYTVVGTYDGNTLKLYINGSLDNTMEATGNIKTIDLPFFIGANPQTDGNHIEYFNGTISDAIVIDDSLTEEEIRTYYSNEVKYNENENTLFYYNLRGYEGRENGSTIPMDMIKTMQVWVPRYKYKVWNYNSDGEQTSEPQEIDITFENGTSSTGNIVCTDNIQGEDGDRKSEICRLKSTNATCTDSICNNKYYTHPAFTFGEEELTGFWIGKFELTGSIENISAKPNINSMKNKNISSFETNIMAMNDENNQYGFSTSADTHMIKNMEWGAAAYLSHSKYGTCTNGTCHEVGLNNNSNYITGCGSEAGSSSSANCNTYNTEHGMLASTTGNVYGIYDMSGGSYEVTMANTISPNGQDMLSGRTESSNSGYTGIVYDGGNYTNYIGIDYPDTKYYDKYSFGINTEIIRSKLGDALKEVSSSKNYGWYDDYLYLGNNEFPWSGRGGNYANTAVSGIFYSGQQYAGCSLNNTTSRLIIIP